MRPYYDQNIVYMNMFIILITPFLQNDCECPHPNIFLVPLCLFHKSTSVNHCTKKTWVSGLGLLQLNIGANLLGRVCILITGNTCLMCWEDVCYVHIY